MREYGRTVYRERATFVALLFASAVVVTAPTALADPTSAADKIAAETLFQEGLRLKKAGQYLEAASKFDQVQKIEPGIGNLLHLAQSYELAGRLASAWGNYKEAAAAAQQARDPREKMANDYAARLEPKLARLAVDLGTNATLEGLVVSRGGQGLGATTAGVPIPVDAGTLVVEVKADGHEPHREEVTLKDGELRTVKIPPLVASPKAPEPSPAAPPVAKPRPRVEPAPVAARSGSKALWVSGIATSVGALASAGVAAAFSVRAVDLDEESAALCGGLACSSQEGADLSAKAFTAAHVATATTIGAGVLGATSVALWVAASVKDGDEAKTTSVAVIPWSDGRASGLAVGGTW